MKPWYKRLDGPLILAYFVIYSVVLFVLGPLESFPELFVGILVSMYSAFGLVGRDRWVKPNPPAPREPQYDPYDKRIW